MIIHEIEGDLFEFVKLPTNKHNIICHVVNCQGKMGTGFASQLKMEYRECFDGYENHCKVADKKDLMGTNFIIPPLEGGMTICNMFAQERYGHEKRHLDYEAFFKCLEDLSKCHFSEIGNGANLIFPKYVGCGNAGGNWEIVYTMIKEVFKDSDLNIYFIERK